MFIAIYFKLPTNLHAYNSLLITKRGYTSPSKHSQKFSLYIYRKKTFHDYMPCPTYSNDVICVSNTNAKATWRKQYLSVRNKCEAFGVMKS